MVLVNPQQRLLIVRTLQGLGFFCLVVWVAVSLFLVQDGGGVTVGIFPFVGLYLVPPALLFLWLAHFINLGGKGADGTE